MITCKHFALSYKNIQSKVNKQRTMDLAIVMEANHNLVAIRYMDSSVCAGRHFLCHSDRRQRASDTQTQKGREGGEERQRQTQSESMSG